MAIKGMRSNEQREYICRDDPARTKEDGATVFYHKPISNAVITRISDQQSSASMAFGDNTQTQTFQQRMNYRNRECFRFGITGWDNFFDDAGQPIMFDTQIAMEGGKTYPVVADHVLDCIFNAVIQEVGSEIWNTNNLTDEQRKKFVASLSLLDGSPNSDAETVTSKTDGGAAAPNPLDDIPAEGKLPEGAIVVGTAPTSINTGKTPQPANGSPPAPAA